MATIGRKRKPEALQVPSHTFRPVALHAPNKGRTILIGNGTTAYWAPSLREKRLVVSFALKLLQQFVDWGHEFIEALLGLRTQYRLR
jgi:hypothetical protein